MTNNRPIPPRKPTPPQPINEPVTQNSFKPYKLIPLSNKTPQRKHPVGQDRYKSQLLSGKLCLKLTVKTSTFVASGVVVMGSDLSSRTKNIPLVKVAVGKDEKLIIPGSSLKGVIRSTYEAITLSCLCKTKANREAIPNGYKECNDKQKLCPACQVFGAMGWQGLISFNDAIADEIKPSIGFMPSLHNPRPKRDGYYLNGKVAGRKFYYHAIKPVDKGQQQGIPVQQAGNELTFSTQLQFMNLTKAELGTLLIVLGQDKNNNFALKVGGGKPIGMGTMIVELTKIERCNDLKNRYLDYCYSENDFLAGDKLKQYIQELIQASHNEKLVQIDALKELKEIWKYPTTREAPQDMY
ncbi:RAMP superfamily CRISPR-associated protein [Merismopedia glauca]|uniref:CRISPR-associated protein n=1 Tax=Merismopedia glauca CCAP 1448/3 TaxID=1296344 RepID=A0A2T1BZU8_9CYAN|nr:RAMP superfamily CRISPR-associated protein [Merismopedia glauca]PSB01550.1 CRISPR-associated protein [Merismopedia glauca CCAP 1448/3]